MKTVIVAAFVGLCTLVAGGPTVSAADAVTRLVVGVDGSAPAAFAAVGELRPRQGSNKELRLTLGDLEAFAHLGNYYAEKIRGACELALYDATAKREHQTQAIGHLETALEHWKRYAVAYTSQYKQPVLYNRVGVVDIPGLTEKVAGDITMAREWKPGTYNNTQRPKPGADRPFRP